MISRDQSRGKGNHLLSKVSLNPIGRGRLPVVLKTETLRIVSLAARSGETVDASIDRHFGVRYHPDGFKPKE
jgi:hypothetical protein